MAYLRRGLVEGGSFIEDLLCSTTYGACNNDSENQIMFHKVVPGICQGVQGMYEVSLLIFEGRINDFLSLQR